MKTYQEFVHELDGRKLDYDGSFGNQCVDLAKKYAVEVVGARATVGNANNWANNYDSARFDYYTNTPLFVPRQGDIVVWGLKIGPYGHIGVVDHANIIGFTSFDQNWPLNTGCHFVNHSYSGVVAFLRPKTQVDSTFKVVATSDLNVRISPNASNTPAFSVKQGKQFTVVGLLQGSSVSGNSTWYKVGESQYISSFYTRKV